MGFSRSPKLVKGAFVQVDNHSSVQKSIHFQYNPEKIDRSIKLCEDSKDSLIRRNRNAPATAEVTPREFLILNLVLDASDAMENPNDNLEMAENGIYSKLSAIELLLYPKKYVLTNRKILGINVPLAKKNESLTLFVWGNKRIIPVQINKIHIVEEMFDNTLNPVRARVEISMWVLNDTDLLHNKKGMEYWNKYIAGKISFAEKAYGEANPDDSKDS